MATQIKIRRDSYANWFNVNPTLGIGEPGYDTTNKKLKIGDGVTLWRALGYFDDQVTDLSAYAGSIVPSVDVSQSIGSPAKRWQKGFFSGNAVYLGDIKLSNNNGTLVVQRVTNAGLENEAAVPSTPGSVTTDRLVNGANFVSLLANGSIVTPTFTIPNTAGTSGQVLKWPGSGNTLVWSSDNSGAGVAGGASVTTGVTPPGAPSLGDLWYDTDSGRIYIYFDSSWIDASPSTGAAPGAGPVTGPATATDNAITRFDTAGNLLQNSLVTISDLGAIVAPMASSIIPFHYDNQAGFPSATTYHGAIAHSHADGKMYFAHSGAWLALANASELPAAYSATSIDALSDVNTTTTAPTNGQALIWNSTSSSWVPGSVASGSISTLSGVTITSPTAGQVLKYNGTSWINDADAVSGGAGVGTVTAVSVVSANGFTGTVATSSSTPAITIRTSITGMLKGNGTAISAAVAGTDYQAPVGTISGIVKGNGANALTAAVAGTDYQAPVGTISGIVKGNGANALTAAVAGTDYQAPVGTISGIVKGNGANALTAAVAGTDYQSAQSVTGIVKSSGTTRSAAVAGTDYQAPITLTTTGSSGAATFSSNTLNIPQYTGSSNITWTIAAADSSNYTFSGPGIVAGNTTDPVLYLYRGFTYVFVNTTGSNHPFAIRVSNGGVSYTSGVSGSTTGTQTFVVPMNAPSTLYYQCTLHGVMGNTINIL